MIKAILAIDDKGGVGKNGSMPWPHNLKDLQWFKENTLGHVVIMGKNTWIDPNMPTPLTKRVNVLATTTDPTEHPGADHYIKGDLIENINELENKYSNKIVWIIGGPNIFSQLISIVEELYLTRIYGDFSCDKNLDMNIIKNNMKIIKRIECDSSCHFEIWSK